MGKDNRAHQHANTNHNLMTWDEFRKKEEENRMEPKYYIGAPDEQKEKLHELTTLTNRNLESINGTQYLSPTSHGFNIISASTPEFTYDTSLYKEVSICYITVYVEGLLELIDKGLLPNNVYVWVEKWYDNIAMKVILLNSWILISDAKEIMTTRRLIL